MTPNPQDSAVALEVERAKFEAWAQSLEGSDGLSLARHIGPSYFYTETHRAWQAWQARASQSDGTSGGWISVDERLPGPGVIVLAFFRNCYGSGRIVRAHHAPKHTIEAGHWDEDAETDNTEDGSFEPEGWYEDPAAGETLTFISPQSDGVVSHWMTLPAAPSQGENHVG